MDNRPQYVIQAEVDRRSRNVGYVRDGKPKPMPTYINHPAGSGNMLVYLLWVVGAIAIALYLSSCTIQRPQYSFSIHPIDPPIQPIENANCFIMGYDGLACRDYGQQI